MAQAHHLYHLVGRDIGQQLEFGKKARTADVHALGNEAHRQLGIVDVVFYQPVHTREKIVVYRRLRYLGYRLGGRVGELLHEQPPHVEHVADARLKIFHGERLLDVSVGSTLHALGLAVVIGLGREHDERNVTRVAVGPHPPAKLSAVHHGHHPVAHDERHGVLLESLQSFSPVFGRHHPVARAEISSQKAAHVGIVFHDEHSGRVFSLPPRQGQRLPTRRFRPVWRLQGLFLPDGHIVAGHRQHHREARSPALFRVHRHLAPVEVYQCLDDAQSDARARFVVTGLKKGIEYLLPVGFTDAYAVVFHLDAKMPTVSIDRASQPDTVFGVFPRIGQQIADNLGQPLRFHHRHEVFRWIVCPEGYAPLSVGRCKAFGHAGHEPRDVLQPETGLSAGLLHFVEVEQLVDECKQSPGVAVDHLQVVGKPAGRLAPQAFQRTDDERHGRAYLVGYHREEAETRLTHLGLLALVEQREFAPVAVLRLPQPEVGVEVNEIEHEQQIKQTGGQAPPERRMHRDGEPGLLPAPQSVVVGGLHAEGVRARGNVGVGGRVLRAHVVPVLVEAFEHVGILVFLRRAITQRGERETEHIVAIGQIHLPDVVQCLG